MNKRSSRRLSALMASVISKRDSIAGGGNRLNELKTTAREGTEAVIEEIIRKELEDERVFLKKQIRDAGTARRSLALKAHAASGLVNDDVVKMFGTK